MQLKMILILYVKEVLIVHGEKDVMGKEKKEKYPGLIK